RAPWEASIVVHWATVRAALIVVVYRLGGLVAGMSSPAFAYVLRGPAGPGSAYLLHGQLGTGEPGVGRAAPGDQLARWPGRAGHGLPGVLAVLGQPLDHLHRRVAHLHRLPRELEPDPVGGLEVFGPRRAAVPAGLGVRRQLAGGSRAPGLPAGP